MIDLKKEQKKSNPWNPLLVFLGFIFLLVGIIILVPSIIICFIPIVFIKQVFLLLRSFKKRTKKKNNSYSTLEAITQMNSHLPFEKRLENYEKKHGKI